MKILYCISAYTDPKSLESLIRALDSADSLFSVHIDKKVDEISDFLAVINNYPNARLCEKRFYVQWGGWNQVLYQEQFLQEAIKIDGVERVVLLTGQDYPLWSNAKLRHFFETNPDRILMKGINLTKVSNDSPMYRLLEVYHFGRDWHIGSHELWRFTTGALRKLMTILPIKKNRYIEVGDERWDIWQASGYFSINREQAKYVLDILENKKFRDYFRTCFVPEELTIPTIIFNSKYKCNADIDESNIYKGLSTLAAMHLFEYGKSIKVYEEKDFAEIKVSNKMFVRKVKSSISDSLINRIESEIRQ